MAMKENFISMAPDEESNAKVSLIDQNKTLMIDQYTTDVEAGNPEFVEDIHVPKQITGYEYQFVACRQALIDGLLEPREMPLEETLYIMELMDGFRKKWGVKYPMDE